MILVEILGFFSCPMSNPRYNVNNAKDPNSAKNFAMTFKTFKKEYLFSRAGVNMLEHSHYWLQSLARRKDNISPHTT